MRFLANILHAIKLMGFRANRAEFYDELAKSYESKEALRDFLSAELRIATQPKTRDGSRAYALRIVARRQAIGDQNNYSSLLGSVMPASDQMMLTALDDAPDKPDLMRTLAKAVRSQAEIISIVRSKLIPPLLLLPGAFAFAYILATRSIPIIVQIAPPEVWTTFNQAVRSFAEFTAANGGKSIVAAVLVGMLFFHQLPRWTGTWRMRLENVQPRTAMLLFPMCPFLLPLGIYRDLQVGLMFSSLAVMLQAGRTLNEALLTVRASSQPWMRWQIRKILAHLEFYPTEYSKAFSKGLLSPQVLARLSSQIRTNPRFDQVLIKIGTQGGDDIRKEVIKQTGVINAMLLVAGGALVIFMMLGQLNIAQTMADEMSPTTMLKKSLMKKQGMAIRN